MFFWWNSFKSSASASETPSRLLLSLFHLILVNNFCCCIKHFLSFSHCVFRNLMSASHWLFWSIVLFIVEFSDLPFKSTSYFILKGLPALFPLLCLALCVCVVRPSASCYYIFVFLVGVCVSASLFQGSPSGVTFPWWQDQYLHFKFLVRHSFFYALEWSCQKVVGLHVTWMSYLANRKKKIGVDVSGLFKLLHSSLSIIVVRFALLVGQQQKVGHCSSNLWCIHI